MFVKVIVMMAFPDGVVSLGRDYGLNPGLNNDLKRPDQGLYTILWIHDTLSGRSTKERTSRKTEL